MANIFVSAFSGNLDANNKYAVPCFIDSFLNELVKSGNSVLFFSSKYFLFKEGQKPDSSLIDRIEKFSPDLIILFNNCFYDYNFSEKFYCPIVVLEVDSYLYFSNKHILNNKNNYLYVVQADDSIKNIHENFNCDLSHIYRIPVFTSVKADGKTPKINISFIGSFFNYTNFIRRFMLSNPSLSDISEFKKICDFLEKNPFVSEEAVMNEFNLRSSFLRQNLSVDTIGAFICSSKRIKTLSAIADLGLDLYGTESWITVLDYYPEIALSFNMKKVYSLEDNQCVYNNSKIGISIAHFQAKSGFPLRIMDVMASNACLVSDYHEDFSLYFPEVSIPTYSSPAEAREVCSKLLKEDNLRKDIVAQCHEVINKKYRFDRYLSDLENVAGIPLRTKQKGNIEFLFNEKRCKVKADNRIGALSLKNKMQYKIWKHLDKKLRKKGIIQ